MIASVGNDESVTTKGELSMGILKKLLGDSQTLSREDLQRQAAEEIDQLIDPAMKAKHETQGQVAPLAGAEPAISARA